MKIYIIVTLFLYFNSFFGQEKVESFVFCDDSTRKFILNDDHIFLYKRADTLSDFLLTNGFLSVDSLKRFKRETGPREVGVYYEGDSATYCDEKFQGWVGHVTSIKSSKLIFMDTYTPVVEMRLRASDSSTHFLRIIIQREYSDSMGAGGLASKDIWRVMRICYLYTEIDL